jgi:glutamate synthase domain-containing protein 2
MNAHAPHHPSPIVTFDPYSMSEIRRAAATGIYDIRGAGAKRKASRISTTCCSSARRSRATRSKAIARNAAPMSCSAPASPKKPIEIKIPITIAGMSFGSLSAQAKEALGRGASACRHLDNHRRWRHDAGRARALGRLVYQVLPSRYGMNPDDLRRADAIEVVVGQGAKPGGGGMLLGQKITERVAGMRTLPPGIDQRSACRHPDWTGPDDLEIKIEELREITDWEKPIYVKVGASRPYYDTALCR